MAVVSPSFISFFSYNMAHGASEAPYSNQRYTLAEKGKADFVYKGRRWPSPFPPWKKLYRQPAGFIMQHLWTTREGKIPLKRKRKGAGVRCGGGAGGLLLGALGWCSLDGMSLIVAGVQEELWA